MVAAAGAALAFALAAARVDVNAAENTGVISGVVTSSNGPEAGVWVIAETDGLPDEVPQDRRHRRSGPVPAAGAAAGGNYNVWVRGYGLVDSQAGDGQGRAQNVKLTAVVAQARRRKPRRVYPAQLLAVADRAARRPASFPARARRATASAPSMNDQAEWINNMKGCMRCHQIGSKLTRTIPDRDKFHVGGGRLGPPRRATGQRGAEMSGVHDRFGRQRGLQMFADWTDRIEAGEVPPAPPRPPGIERNVVITMWDWGDEDGVRARRDRDRQAQSARERRTGRFTASTSATTTGSLLDPREAQRRRC